MSFDDPIEINGKKYVMVEVIEPRPIHEKLAHAMFMESLYGEVTRIRDFARVLYPQATKSELDQAEAHFQENYPAWFNDLFERHKAQEASA